MKSLSDYITEARVRHMVKKTPNSEKYDNEYGQYFDINPSYHKPIPVSLATLDWDGNAPKHQPKGSIVIGTGKHKDKVFLTNNGDDNLWDEIIKLNDKNGDLELYVQLKYQGDEEFAYPIYKVSDEGDSSVMVSVSPNNKISTTDIK